MVSFLRSSRLLHGFKKIVPENSAGGNFQKPRSNRSENMPYDETPTMKGIIMNKTQKIIAVAIISTAVAAWIKFAPNKTAQYFAERYPHLDQKLVMDAHDKLMGLAFRGKLDLANWGEEKYNEMLLQTIAQMQAEK